MNGQAILEIKLAPARVAVYERGPVQIGQVMPALLERYGLDEPRPTVSRRQVQTRAVWLGQQSLSGLAEMS